MRVLLRNIESGFYYTANKKWAPNPDLALDWSNVERARKLSRRQEFRGAEIVLAYEGPGLRTPYTQRHRRCQEVSLRLGFAEGLR